jgi:hypothetical protein
VVVTTKKLTLLSQNLPSSLQGGEASVCPTLPTQFETKVASIPVHHDCIPHAGVYERVSPRADAFVWAGVYDSEHTLTLTLHCSHFDLAHMISILWLTRKSFKALRPIHETACNRIQLCTFDHACFQGPQPRQQRSTTRHMSLQYCDHNPSFGLGSGFQFRRRHHQRHAVRITALTNPADGIGIVTVIRCGRWRYVD